MCAYHATKANEKNCVHCFHVLNQDEMMKVFEFATTSTNFLQQHIARPLMAGPDSTLPRGLFSPLLLSSKASLFTITNKSVFMWQWSICWPSNDQYVDHRTINRYLSFLFQPSLCNSGFIHPCHLQYAIRKEKTKNSPKTKPLGACKWRWWLFDLGKTKRRNDFSKTTRARVVCR